MPNVTAPTRQMGNGDVVTQFVDSVGTSAVTYTYPKTQEKFRVRNMGQQSLSVTVAGTTQTVVAGSKWETVADFTSFAINAVSGITAFDAWADEKGSTFDSPEGKYFGGSPVSSSTSAASATGNTFVFWGDSITSGYTNGPFGDTCFPLYASLLSNGKIRTAYNAGISGQTSTQILARFATDVLAYKPAMCTILAGTNDIPGGIPLATTKANIESMITQCQSNGITPILCTIPPAAAVGNRSATTKLNVIIRALAQKYKLSLVDMYSLLADPTNGAFKASLTLDGTHPNVAGALLMGQTFNNQISPLLPNANLLLPVYSNDGANGMVDGLFFTDTTPVDGLADSWTKSGAGAATTALVTNDTAILGNWQELTKTVNDTNTVSIFTNGYSLTNGTSGWNRGDKIVICCRIKTVNIEAGVLTFTLKQGAGDTLLSNFSKDGDWLIYKETTFNQIDNFGAYLTLTLNKGTGTVRIAQAGIYNLTALGVNY